MKFREIFTNRIWLHPPGSNINLEHEDIDIHFSSATFIETFSDPWNNESEYGEVPFNPNIETETLTFTRCWDRWDCSLSCSLSWDCSLSFPSCSHTHQDLECWCISRPIPIKTVQNKLLVIANDSFHWILSSIKNNIDWNTFWFWYLVDF